MKSARPKLITASTQISTDPITIAGVILTGGADAAVINIFNEGTDDKTSAKKIATIKAAINTTVTVNLQLFLNEGCYVELSSGTTPDITLLIR